MGGDPLAESGRGYQCRKSDPGETFRGKPEILQEVVGSASKIHKDPLLAVLHSPHPMTVALSRQALIFLQKIL